MTVSLILACVWALSANLIAFFPSKHAHWPAAYGLIATGLPLLFWVIYENGIVIGVLVLLAAASILRWPLRYLVNWIVGFARPHAGS